MAENTFRPHVPPHKRSMQEQTLDVLLRIEEILLRNQQPQVTGTDMIETPAIKNPELAKKPEQKGGRDGKRRL